MNKAIRAFIAMVTLLGLLLAIPVGSQTVTPLGTTGTYTTTGPTDSILTGRYGRGKLFFTTTAAGSIYVIVEGSAGSIGGTRKWTNISAVGDTEKFIMATDDSTNSLEYAGVWPMIRAKITYFSGIAAKSSQWYFIGQEDY